MKPTLFIGLLLFGGAIRLSAQTKPQHLFEQAIQLMQSHAVESASVNWPEVHSEALVIGQRTEPFDLGSAIRHVFAALNDFHGVLYHGDSSYQWQTHELKPSADIVAAWQSGAGIATARFADGTAYLRIPGMPYLNRETANQQAQALNDSLCHLLQTQPKGLIIDLRLNGGGAMYPMILGLQALLPKGVLGAYYGKTIEHWYLGTHALAIEADTMASLHTACAPVSGLPIVFINSNITGSSAEYVLMAFAQYPQKILLGSRTAGFVTATQGFPLGEEAFLLLSTAYGADRLGNLYRSAFEPDVPLDGPNHFFDLANDAKVSAARRWLVGR